MSGWPGPLSPPTSASLVVYNFITIVYLFCVCMWVLCEYMHGPYEEARGQLTGVRSFLPPYGSPGVKFRSLDLAWWHTLYFLSHLVGLIIPFERVFYCSYSFIYLYVWVSVHTHRWLSTALHVWAQIVGLGCKHFHHSAILPASGLRSFRAERLRRRVLKVK